jgi:hypothetical protein
MKKRKDKKGRREKKALAQYRKEIFIGRKLDSFKRTKNTIPMRTIPGTRVMAHRAAQRKDQWYFFRKRNKNTKEDRKRKRLSV